MFEMPSTIGESFQQYAFRQLKPKAKELKLEGEFFGSIFEDASRDPRAMTSWMRTLEQKAGPVWWAELKASWLTPPQWFIDMKGKWHEYNPKWSEPMPREVQN